MYELLYVALDKSVIYGKLVHETAQGKRTKEVEHVSSLEEHTINCSVQAEPGLNSCTI